MLGGHRRPRPPRPHILDSAIATKFSGGGPVGLSTLAAAVDEEQDTIEDAHEPYLQRGLLKRTPPGPRHHQPRD